MTPEEKSKDDAIVEQRKSITEVVIEVYPELAAADDAALRWPAWRPAVEEHLRRRGAGQ